MGLNMVKFVGYNNHMKLRNRFLLVAFGVTIFVLSTPVIVLYALGYKFDLSSRQVVKTGSLIVKSEPDDATISIDGLQQRSKTDATIRFLLPGDYNIRISKDGYQPWTKRLNIRSEFVTWANFEREYITLFRESAQKGSTARISQAVASPDKSQAMLVSDEQVSLLNPDRGQVQQVNGAPSFAGVTLSDKQSLYYLLRYAQARAFSPEQLAAASHLEANDAYGVILAGGQLLQSKNQTLKPVAQNVSGFTLENEHLWYVQGNELRHANLDARLEEPGGA